MTVKLKTRKGDLVIVTKGKDAGKKGEVLRVFPQENKVIIAGVNMAIKHVKPSRVSEGGRVSVEKKIDLSNVAHVDPELGVATKVGYKFLEDGTKVLFAKKSGKEIVRKELGK